MDAYVLGQHDGELPTHLLEAGEPGNRVRAIARLEGPEHNVFYALEVPTHEVLEEHVTTITDAGTTTQHSMALCVTPDCVGLLGGGGSSVPSFMPPYILYWLYKLTHPGDPVEAKALVAVGLDRAREILGQEGVAAGTDGNGNTIIELGSDDEAALQEADRALSEHFGQNLSRGHAVSGGFVKA